MAADPTAPEAVHEAGFADLDAVTLYALLRLRSEVFVVEQECAYPDLDGRDLEPGTRHVWLAEDGVPVAYLRILQGGGASRIGRVLTAPAARGRGLADRLMRRALLRCAGGPVTLEAQAHLEGWYARYGFVRAGETYLEDGIAHVPMRLAG